jgi:cell division transport system ATP-binding protein
MVLLENVSVSFDQQIVLRNVSARVRRGEFVCLVGETGVGKTTLLRLLYFDLLPETGRVQVGEFDSSTIRREDIPALRRTLGIAFQDYRLLDDRSVYRNVAFPLEVTGMEKGEVSKRVLRVLADVGMSHKRNNYPEELSGGEQQRVVIARALVNDPECILADEPTGNLDPATSLEILGLLKSAKAAGTSVILATHNYELVRNAGGRILSLHDGEISEVTSV